MDENEKDFLFHGFMLGAAVTILGITIIAYFGII